MYIYIYLYNALIYTKTIRHTDANVHCNTC